ncbi:MAG: protein-L-isoaspartate(D-aspartate) O-methyltransferase [Gemmatimonas sp.]|nr:protein-L-isoaspartate(D-aspartate) O-methyltransferase [Gemmatimonas sp.]
MVERGGHGLPGRRRGLHLRHTSPSRPDQLQVAARHRALGFEPVIGRFAAQRRGLIELLQDQGIRDLAILRAFDLVPRHEFLPEAVRHRAYEDAALPIGLAQTASQPSLQALYMELLRLQPHERVLEVGTGSGFQTAVLAQLVRNVHSVERLRPLAIRAREALDRLQISNVAILVGDGTIGWSRYAPYDAILVTAGSPTIPEPLVRQLRIGGRMIVPVGTMDSQKLMMVVRTNESYEADEVLACSFVPLLGRFGWTEREGSAD